MRSDFGLAVLAKKLIINFLFNLTKKLTKLDVIDILSVWNRQNLTK